VSEIVTREDFKLAIGGTVADPAEELDLLLDRVEADFKDDIGQDKLMRSTYTAEKYRGNGYRSLQLKRYPLQTVTSVTLADESAINPADPLQLEYLTGVQSDGILYLHNRVWTKRSDKLFNITITYDAGYEPTTIKTDLQGARAVIIAAAVLAYRENQAAKRDTTKLSQAFMSGSIAYLQPSERVVDPQSEFYRTHWRPVVARHRRQSPIEVMTG